MTRIERPGAKTARRLFQKHGIDSLPELAQALESEHLDKGQGIGAKMKQTIREHLGRHR